MTHRYNYLFTKNRPDNYNHPHYILIMMSAEQGWNEYQSVCLAWPEIVPGTCRYADRHYYYKPTANGTVLLSDTSPFRLTEPAVTYVASLKLQVPRPWRQGCGSAHSIALRFLCTDSRHFVTIHCRLTVANTVHFLL